MIRSLTTTIHNRVHQSSCADSLNLSTLIPFHPTDERVIEIVDSWLAGSLGGALGGY